LGKGYNWKSIQIQILLIMLVSVSLMLPRLWEAEFGLFDDPTTVTRSQLIIKGDWGPQDEAENGRYRPMYWYYNTALYLIFGLNPIGYYLGNVFLLTILLIAFFLWLRNMGWRDGQIWISILTLIPTLAVVENLYTLSKPELLQTTWYMLAFLIASIRIPRGKRWTTLAYTTICGIFILFAGLTKETAILILPIVIGMESVIWILKLYPARLSWSLWNRRLLVGTLVGSIGYLMLRRIHLPFGLIASGYPSRFNFELEFLMDNAKIWADLVLRDYLYIIPLLLPAGFQLLSTRKREHWLVFLFGSLWSLAWLLAYIPWPFTQSYYLMPFALGVSILSGACYPYIQLEIEQRIWRAWLARMSLLAAIFLVLVNVVNQTTAARMQMVIDRENANVIDRLSQTIPIGSEILLNIQNRNEYVGQFRSYVIRIAGREDLKVDHIRSSSIVSDPTSTPRFYALPIFRNQFYPSMRMGIFEHTSKQWNTDFLDQANGAIRKMFQTTTKFRAILIDPLRMVCLSIPNSPYCQVPHNPLDDRVVEYGWVVYDQP
jgi:hypothetical protein